MLLHLTKSTISSIVTEGESCMYATSFPLDPMRKIVGGGGEDFFFVGCNAFIDNLQYRDLRKIAMGEIGTTMQ